MRQSSSSFIRFIYTTAKSNLISYNAHSNEQVYCASIDKRFLPMPTGRIHYQHLVSMCCRCVTVRGEFANRMSSSKSSAPPKLVAFGNVLLDSTINVNNLDILNQYGLSLDSKGEIDIQTLTKISQEVRQNAMATQNCGGSALNTVRILKQLGTDALFFGAIGEDSAADLVKGILKKSGIRTSLQVTPEHPTGQCVCFLYGRQNALYANIGASSKFSLDYLQKAEEEENFIRRFKRRQIFYLEGFFLPERIDITRHIVRNYVSGQRILALNLSAPYIIEENFDIITFLVHSAELIFGNRSEFTMLSKKCGFRSVDEFAKQELTQKPTTIFVITNDKKNVQLIRNVGTRDDPNVVFDCFAVPMVPVVDPTGAGDSFAAGFLHSFLNGCPLTKCIQHAISVASLVVQQVGCNLPVPKQSV